MFLFACSAIGRSLIPRYFRSMFEGGITDLYYVLKFCKESFQNTSIILDCEQAMMVTHHSKPVFTKVIQFVVHVVSLNSVTFVGDMILLSCTEQDLRSLKYCLYGCEILDHYQ